ncbi:YcdB/YcdC domain-containing protein [Sporosarcina sp.]|uniref:YcdB/YcdC domain-containing protein n=1 Tax=Sporosarcina sp. TaxID=49982 RepID=UPI002608EBC3|nr:YcdB/YcdC domain-containing protein [Sporosarcina sp.]
MEQTLTALAKFMTEQVRFIENEEEDFFEGRTFEIADVESEELLAVCVLDSSDQLVSFYYVESYESGEMKAEEMPAVAGNFIKAFYPEGLETYRLQSVIDLDDSCIVEYGINEEKHGLYLPGIGFSVTISTAGRIVQFSYSHDPLDIRYPAQMITADEAKEKYAELIDFELIIRKTDTANYVNGDDTYRLVYAVKEAAVDIPASGEEPDTVSEGNQFEAVLEDRVPEESLYEMLGVTDDHVKIGGQVEEGIRTELWQHASLDIPDEIDLSSVYNEQMITIQFDSATNSPVFIANVEGWQGEQESLEDQMLKARALDFLYKVFPRAKAHFLLEFEEPEEEWLNEFDDGEEVEEPEEEWETFCDEDLEEVEEEDSKVFYFHYHVGGIPVEGCVTAIQVGLYSGHIISASVEPADETPFLKLNTEPALTKAQAKELLMQKLQMELAMANEFDEEGESFYQLTYLPSYPETTGHIQMIDAENGKGYFVDTGDSIFY